MRFFSNLSSVWAWLAGWADADCLFSLRLGKRSVTPSPVPEPHAFIESLPQVGLASLQGVDVIIGKTGKVK